MTENEINITDMIKALQCIASQDADGDCYCDHFNAHLTCEQFGDNARLDEKHMSCGGIIKDTQSCPYSQKTYGVCFEDGELWWLKDIVSILTEIQQYRAIGTVEEIEKSMQNVSVLLAEHELLKLYQSIGTIEEFKALKEKATPKKPIPNKPLEEGKIICWSCPNCRKENWNGYYFPPLTFDKVCTDCLQAIDWSE